MGCGASVQRPTSAADPTELPCMAAPELFQHVDHTEIKGKLRYASFEQQVLDLQLHDLAAHREVITALVAKFRENWSRGLGSESFVEDTFVRTGLRNCIFVGHIHTDLDSIAGAICAAELFGGVAARSEEDYNGEIEYALKFAARAVPPTFDEVNAEHPQSKVCLVDHNEADQMTVTLRNDPNCMKRVAGLIDHHAVAASFRTSQPLFMDVRPWGSMCSIVFHLYLRNRVPVRKDIARLLLCAILSDTLNLRSGTTTPADRFSVALLSEFAEVDDILALALELFGAKTRWIVGLGAYEMVRGDQKNFTAGDVRFSIAVLEVTDMSPVLDVAEEILTQLRVFKHEQGDYIDPDTGERRHDPSRECHCALLFVVNTVEQRSVALVCGSRERLALRAAFPEASWRAAAPGVRTPSQEMTAEETLCDVGPLVSRKLDFVPRCSEALRKDLPAWFTKTSSDQARLVRALTSEECQPLVHNSVRVLWDKPVLMCAVFAHSAAAAT